MVGIFLLGIVMLGCLVAGVATRHVLAGGVAAAVILVLGIAALTLEQVDEGNVAIPVTFGKAGQPVGPGVHFAAPWTNYVEMNTREQVISFEGDDPNREALGIDDITMQTQGGGGFDLDARVRVALPVPVASDVWRTLGTGYVEAVVIPSGRECIRDASVNMGLTEAITTGRPEIADRSEDCLRIKLTDAYGIRVIGVELGGTQVPPEVQSAINAKQGAEQQRQAAEIELERARIDADRQSVEAKATSDAEQIIACGASVDDNGKVVPNETCEDQFSDEYLDWLYIQQLDSVDTLIVVDREIISGGSQIILDTSGGTTDGARVSTPRPEATPAAGADG